MAKSKPKSKPKSKSQPSLAPTPSRGRLAGALGVSLLFLLTVLALCRGRRPVIDGFAAQNLRSLRAMYKSGPMAPTMRTPVVLYTQPNYQGEAFGLLPGITYGYQIFPMDTSSKTREYLMPNGEVRDLDRKTIRSVQMLPGASVKLVNMVGGVKDQIVRASTPVLPQPVQMNTIRFTRGGKLTSDHVIISYRPRRTTTPPKPTPEPKAVGGPKLQARSRPPTGDKLRFTRPPPGMYIYELEDTRCLILFLQSDLSQCSFGLGLGYSIEFTYIVNNGRAQFRALPRKQGDAPGVLRMEATLTPTTTRVFSESEPWLFMRANVPVVMQEILWDPTSPYELKHVSAAGTSMSFRRYPFGRMTLPAGVHEHTFTAPNKQTYKLKLQLPNARLDRAVPGTFTVTNDKGVVQSKGALSLSAPDYKASMNLPSLGMWMLLRYPFHVYTLRIQSMSPALPATLTNAVGPWFKVGGQIQLNWKQHDRTINSLTDQDISAVVPFNFVAASTNKTTFVRTSSPPLAVLKKPPPGTYQMQYRGVDYILVLPDSANDDLPGVLRASNSNGTASLPVRLDLTKQYSGGTRYYTLRKTGALTTSGPNPTSLLTSSIPFYDLENTQNPDGFFTLAPKGQNVANITWNSDVPDVLQFGRPKDAAHNAEYTNSANAKKTIYTAFERIQ